MFLESHIILTAKEKLFCLQVEIRKEKMGIGSTKI